MRHRYPHDAKRDWNSQTMYHHVCVGVSFHVMSPGSAWYGVPNVQQSKGCPTQAACGHAGARLSHCRSAVCRAIAGHCVTVSRWGWCALLPCQGCDVSPQEPKARKRHCFKIVDHAVRACVCARARARVCVCVCVCVVCVPLSEPHYETAPMHASHARFVAHVCFHVAFMI